MRLLSRLPFPQRIAFLAAIATTLAFALYTNHAWEDYYITYRSSKNLATGHGLVFNHGDRLHTFTSPLGVLLPALGNWLTGNRSDLAALWVFRIFSIAAFGGAAVFLYSCARNAQRTAFAAVLAAGWLVTDAKSLDFTINGMETGFVLLFVAWILWAQFAELSRRWLWLGIGWAGLMWTRPDGFLYIGLLAAGAWLFADRNAGAESRMTWVKTCFKAGLVCTALYLPWTIIAWSYYGTPIPHTIVAKAALVHGPRPLLGAVKLLVTLPWRIWTADTSLPGAFLPSYYMVGGWPLVTLWIAKTLAFIAAFTWLVPGVSRSARTASLAFCGFQVYLSYYPYFPFPWYQPGSAVLGAYAIAGLASLLFNLQLRSSATRSSLRTVAFGVAALVLGLNVWTTPAVARQHAAQQRLIEDGNRRKIGEWLHDNAQPGDSVFMEPLGYIGFFSNLKTYDYPGMSSREMPRAIRDVGTDWAALIEYNEPTWVVLRPDEIRQMGRAQPSLLGVIYEKSKEFDVSDEVRKLDVRGRRYLEIDAHFTVFHRRPYKKDQTDFGTALSLYGSGLTTFDDRQMLMVHAPGYLIVNIPPAAKNVKLAYGFGPGADFGDPQTDGATFEIKISDPLSKREIFRRYVNPHTPAEHGAQIVDLALPPHTNPAVLILQADPGNSTVKDWTCWGKPEFY